MAISSRTHVEEATGRLHRRAARGGRRRRLGEVNGGATSSFLFCAALSLGLARVTAEAFQVRQLGGFERGWKSFATAATARGLKVGVVTYEGEKRGLAELI